MRAFILLALATLALLLPGCAAYGPPRIWGEKIHRNLVFAQPTSPGGRPLRLDLYVPPRRLTAGRPAPVVLWIFGGSWKFGRRGYHVNVRDLTRAGIAVAAIDYRFSDEAIHPAQLDDARAALRWLEANAPRYGLDPTRIGVSGESAGGHLAALLGLTEGRARVRAVFALYPVTDLVDIGRQYADANPSDIERLLGGPIEQRLAAARAASPTEHVTGNAPPFLLLHGTRDTLVPLRHSQRLHDRLRAAGVASTLLLAPEKPHWFLLDPAQKAAVARFFHQHLNQIPPPNPKTSNLKPSNLKHPCRKSPAPI